MDTIGQMGAVAAVLGLLGSALWWLRRRGMATLAIGRKRLSPQAGTGRAAAALAQHSLHLGDWGRRCYWWPPRRAAVG